MIRESPIVKWIIEALAGLLSGAAGVWIARLGARRWRIVSNPNPIVETHKHPVPYLGGLGSLLPYAVLLIVFTGFKTWSILFVGAIGLIVVIGTVDDLRPLPWWFKLAFEAVITSIFIPLILIALGIILNPALIIIAIAAVLAITNGFNLVDVSDGLASGLGLLISIGLFIGFLFHPSFTHLAPAPLFLAGVLGGFLIFNFPPASIYLGDGGSLGLGLALGTLIVLYSSDLSAVRLITAFSLASPVFFEIILISFHRIRKGRSPFRGSPDHFALRLVKKGWSTVKVLLVSLGVSCFLVASVALVWFPRFISWIYLGVLIIFYGLSFWWLSKIKVNQ